jgi:integrase
MARRTSEELWAARRQPRKRGEGSVFEITVNGQKKYRATRTLFMGSDGKAIQVSGTGDSEQEAVKRRDDNWKKRLVQMGELPLNALKSKPKELKTTVGEVLWEWLRWKSRQTSKRDRVDPSVISQYESIIRLHIEPAIGTKSIRLVTKKDLEEFIYVTLDSRFKTRKNEFGDVEVTDEKLLGHSKKRAIQGVINMAFRWATEESIILLNPTIGIAFIEKPQSPAVKEKLEKKLWYPERLAQYLIGHEDEARWLLMMSCGLRAGEKLGVEWNNFRHLTGGGLATLEVCQQLSIDPTTRKLYIKRETKTRAGIRIIPIDKRMVKVLRDYKKVQDSWKELPTWQPLKGMENLVFTTHDGKPIRHQTDTKQWRKLLKDFKLEFVRQHAMRHITISNMVKLGQPIEIIRAIAGHESEAITRATYTHLSPGSKVETINRYSDVLFSAREKKQASAESDKKPIKKLK